MPLSTNTQLTFLVCFLQPLLPLHTSGAGMLFLLELALGGRGEEGGGVGEVSPHEEAPDEEEAGGGDEVGGGEGEEDEVPAPGDSGQVEGQVAQGGEQALPGWSRCYT